MAKRGREKAITASVRYRPTRCWCCQEPLGTGCVQGCAHGCSSGRVCVKCNRCEACCKCAEPELHDSFADAVQAMRAA